jgi:hypothetical protein
MHRCFLGFALLVAGAARPGAAQTTYELRPFVAYRDGAGFGDNVGRPYDLRGHLAYGLGLSVDVKRDFAIEVLVSRQPTEARPTGFDAPIFGVAVTQWGIGASKAFFASPRLKPSVGLLLGLTNFGSQFPTGASSSSFVSVIPSLGATYLVTPRWGVRLEGRGFVTFPSSGESFACLEPNHCAGQFTDDVLWQQELAVSVVYRFGPGARDAFRTAVRHR